MGHLLRILVPLALVAAAIWWLRRPSRVAAGFPDCRTCKHCRSLFPDGTVCGFGPREVFKNEVHVKNCTDYAPRR